MVKFAVAYLAPLSASGQPQKFYLKKGHKYSVWLPSAFMDQLPNNANDGNGEYASFNMAIKYYGISQIAYVVIERLNSYNFSGDNIEYVYNASGQVYAYIALDVNVQIGGNRNYRSYIYDSFVGVVAAGTALTLRTKNPIPYGQKVIGWYSLSVNGAPGTVGDAYYIQIANSGSKMQPASVQGSMSGEMDLGSMTGQHMWIQYINSDTVDHLMAASYQVSVIQ